MERGLPGFPRDFSCPVVLRIPLRVRQTFGYVAITLYSPAFQRVHLVSGLVTLLMRSCNTAVQARRFRLFRFRSPLLSESLLLSLPPGTEMVHFPGLASSAYEFSGRLLAFSQQGFPIRKSPDHCLLAAPRGLSQLATSFIACLRQGIHRTPLVA